ncbi:MAG TPA: hypothetical protein VHV50_10780 [Actinomycetota bacterium]|nr:hypothetical protein [Actinomycetota bacterium]
MPIEQGEREEMGILHRVREEEATGETVEQSYRVLSDMLGESPPEDSDELEPDAEARHDQNYSEPGETSPVTSEPAGMNDSQTDAQLGPQTADPSPGPPSVQEPSDAAEGNETDSAAVTESDPLSQVLDVGNEVNTILRTTRESANSLLRRARQEAETLHDAAVEEVQDLNEKAAEDRSRALEKSVDDATSVKEDADRYAFELRSRTDRDSRQIMEKAEERTQQLHAYQQQLAQHLGEIERLVGALRSDIDHPEQEVPELEESAMEFASS